MIAFEISGKMFSTACRDTFCRHSGRNRHRQFDGFWQKPVEAFTGRDRSTPHDLLARTSVTPTVVVALNPEFLRAITSTIELHFSPFYRSLLLIIKANINSMRRHQATHQNIKTGASSKPCDFTNRSRATKW